MKDLTKKKRVMVIDDDIATIGKFQAEMLADGLGEYQIDFFLDSCAAVDVYSLDPNYDLVITDLCMPKKSGEGLIFDLRFIKPGQKIMVLTGNSDRVNLAAFPDIPVIEKPQRLSAMLDRFFYGKVSELPVNPLADKRVFPRFELEVPVMPVNFELSGAQLKLRNISLGGVCIECSTRFTENQDLYIFEIELLGKKVLLNGEIVWQEFLDLPLEQSTLGLRFKNLPPENKALIESFAQNLSHL